MAICSQYSPVVGLLEGGKYDAVNRPLKAGRWDVYSYLKNAIEQRAQKAAPVNAPL
jgi:hypothetical protein